MESSSFQAAGSTSACGAAGAAAHEVEASAARDAYIHARLQGAVFYALPCCTSLDDCLIRAHAHSQRTPH
jgi:hypothetical protein